MAALTTTTVRRAAAATARDQLVLAAGQGERRLVEGLGLLLLGEPDDHDRDVGGGGGGDGRRRSRRRRSAGAGSATSPSAGPPAEASACRDLSRSARRRDDVGLPAGRAQDLLADVARTRTRSVTSCDSAPTVRIAVPTPRTPTRMAPAGTVADTDRPG